MSIPENNFGTLFLLSRTHQMKQSNILMSTESLVFCDSLMMLDLFSVTLVD